jgi:hypothetical protein
MHAYMYVCMHVCVHTNCICTCVGVFLVLELSVFFMHSLWVLVTCE